MYSCIHCISLHYYARPDFGGSSVAIALSTIAITHLYIISIQIAIMSIVKPCLHNYEINSFLLYLSFNEDRCYLLAPQCHAT